MQPLRHSDVSIMASHRLVGRMGGPSPGGRMAPKQLFLLVGFGISCLASGTTSLQAQAKGKARISGVVLSATNRQPLAGAIVRLLGTTTKSTTKADGTFLFDKLPEGNYRVQVEAEGLTSQIAPVLLGSRDRFSMEFVVGAPPGPVLPELEVVESVGKGRSPRVDFERRRQEGLGRYISRADIVRRNPASLPDLLRMIPGIRIRCRTSTNACQVSLNRSTGCSPAYWLDGIPATDPSVVYLTRPGDIEGVEVYSGSSQVPAELGGAGSRCGVIMIWTRQGQRPGDPRP